VLGGLCCAASGCLLSETFSLPFLSLHPSVEVSLPLLAGHPAFHSTCLLQCGTKTKGGSQPKAAVPSSAAALQGRSWGAMQLPSGLINGNSRFLPAGTPAAKVNKTVSLIPGR
jgi:hypothetical protein